MKRINICSTLAYAVFLAVLFAALAVPADAVYIKTAYLRYGGTAGETLTTGQVIAVKDADGEWYKADSDSATIRPALGIVGNKTGGDGESVEVVLWGLVGGYTGLTEGGAVYLSETAGSYTQSAPAWSQVIGHAVSATEILYNFQNYFDTSSLTALGTLTGASPIILEGASADAYETTFAVTDPTADNTITIPDDTGALILSTLATNAEDVADSVWGATNGIVAEGATADDYEITITWADPTADNTITLPDDTAYVAYQPGGATTSAADSLAIPITHSIVTKTTGADAEALTLADGEEGQTLTITLGTDGGGAGTLTPSTATGWATAVFADAGDTITVQYVDDSVGWILLSAYGLTAQPTVTQ